MPFMPAARVGDMHVCPMISPAPHIGGPVMPPGRPTVLVGGIPAATLGSQLVCVGAPDTIIKGSITVLIGGQPAARLGDLCAHGGVITTGYPGVIIA